MTTLDQNDSQAPEVSTIETDAATTVVAAETYAEATAALEKKSVENTEHGDVHKMLDVIEAFFERIEKPITADIASIRAKL